MENQTICDDFQRCFVNKIAEIKCITSAGSLPPPVHLAHSTPSSLWRFTNTSDEEVIQAIHNIPLKTSSLDFIPTMILKSCSDVFTPLIATLVNLSFSEGRFPDVFKFDQVIPLLKKPRVEDKDMAYFRPIRNLNTIVKILEHLSQNHIRCYIHGSQNIGSLQSAYHELQSMETAMRESG